MRRKDNLGAMLTAAFTICVMAIVIGACFKASREEVYKEPCDTETITILPTEEEKEDTPVIEISIRETPVQYVVKEVLSSEEQKVMVYNASPLKDPINFTTTLPIEDSKEEEECLFLSASKRDIVEYVSPMGNVYEIDLVRLHSLWSEDLSTVGMEMYGYENTVAVLYDFLVYQMNVEHNIACGIIGNCAAEGTFGKKQSVKKYISSIEQAREWLDADSVDTGYGIAQWTIDSRRERLLTYYESAVETFESFEDAQKVAEMVCLYEELESFDIFESYQEEVGIEDATGRVSLYYEKYKYSAQDWTKNEDGTISLTGSKGSGEKRLKYAYRVDKFYDALQ